MHGGARRGAGRAPLPTATVVECRKLLAGGELSQNQIALRLGISRATVQGIAAGRHRPPKPPRRFRRLAELPAGIEWRCPGCGGRLAEYPCRVCLARHNPPARLRKITRAAAAYPRPPGEPPAYQGEPTDQELADAAWDYDPPSGELGAALADALG